MRDWNECRWHGCCVTARYWRASRSPPRSAPDRSGLLGKKSYEGALLLRHTRSVHTIGMRFAIDVAFLTRDLESLSVVTLPPTRIGLPRRGGRCVLEAEAGAFERWGLVEGDQLEIKG